MAVAVRRFSLPSLLGHKSSLAPGLPKIDHSKENCLPDVPEIKECEIREALLSEVAAHFCYGKAAAKEMAITDIKHSIAFHYTLETFTERRATAWISEPFTGGSGSRQGGEGGAPPAPEEIPASPPELFRSHVYHQEIPRTAHVTTCQDCDGQGKHECATCRGQGWEFCPYCRGNKWYPLAVDSFEGDCVKCQGSGERTCWECNGDEEVKCKNCSGAGEIKSYIRLMVIWTNHVNDYVVEKGSALRAHRLRCVTGKVVHEEEGVSLLPLIHFPNKAVGAASVQLLQHHADAFNDEKVLKQRQSVSAIPSAAVCYRWRNHEGMFNVYGNERCVYIPDYPQKYCCCTIS